MNFVTVLFIAAGLAMDAFAVSVSTGMTCCDFYWRHNLKMSLLFGIFQFAMPVAGFFCATRFRYYIENFDHWIAFSLLLLIGSKMLWEAVFANDEKDILENAPSCPVLPDSAVTSAAPGAPETSVTVSGATFGTPGTSGTVRKGLMAADLLTMRHLMILSVATSIDALAVGVSMAFLQVDIWWPSIIIGIVAFAFSFAGGMLGRRIGPILGKVAEITGGLILIGIGVKILLDHLFFS